MKTDIGLWIDHEKAVIISLSNDDEKRFLIESDVESRRRATGGSNANVPYFQGGVESQTHLDERIRHRLQKFYREIIQRLNDADRIYIMGPGKAKQELVKEIQESKHLASKLKAVESSDYMTENQMAAKIRKYFRFKGFQAA